ncbi:MAG: mechanosensitive ion channel [Woeseiaceae bacterium]|nr:mechanosensitive ion channel [Woeseiaceae bacterium]
MPLIRRVLSACLLLSTVASAPLSAQEAPLTEEPEPPVLAELDSNWWNYFDGAPEQIKPRVDAFLEIANDEISELGAQNQELAPGIVEAVADNFAVYLALLEDVDFQTNVLTEPATTYTLDDLLSVAAAARNASDAAISAAGEVEREQRILDGASRRRDALFKDYLGAAEGDGRWLTGLRLVRARTEQAIATRRLEVLTQNAADAAEYAEDIAMRVDLVRERLAMDSDGTALAPLIETLGVLQDSVSSAEEQAREAQILASSLDVDSTGSRSEQRLLQQRALDSEVELALARIALAGTEARQFWTMLNLDSDPDMVLIEDKSIEWSELSRTILGALPDWKLQTEDELLAAQSVDRDELDRAARRVLDQRIGTAQETLGNIGDLEDNAADLDLLILAVDDASTVYSGALKQWLSNVGKTIKTGWIRVSEISGMTLFKVGETPVTPGDIVQAIVILLFGWLLSRLIRYAIRRVGRKESQGAQASLYTISRLSHYTIIIVAVFVALTSMGLDFTNLALVAGALSIGIGFGLQSIVNNFVSGLIILFERTLRVGDYIELDTGLTGTVKGINVRSTLINTNDNIDIVVPNSEFVSTKLTNWTLGEHILRVRIPFGVAYGSDKELVRKAAIEACDEVPYTLTHMRGREPDVWLVEYGDNSLNFLLLVWVNRQGARRPTRTRAAYLWSLETKLNEYGIEIPFPQRDLHLRSGWPPPAESAKGQATDGD